MSVVVVVSNNLTMSYESKAVSFSIKHYCFYYTSGNCCLGKNDFISETLLYDSNKYPLEMAIFWYS